ncbi:hypothetical protein FPRO04_13265 [Fusarium proliferatum]|nr:hypothetical protein FPRO04_13265 [Fusarium proliferatum]
MPPKLSIKCASSLCPMPSGISSPSMEWYTDLMSLDQDPNRAANTATGDPLTPKEEDKGDETLAWCEKVDSEELFFLGEDGPESKRKELREKIVEDKLKARGALSACDDNHIEFKDYLM